MKIEEIVAPLGMLALFVMCFFLMPIVDEALAPSMSKFNEWANEKTKDMPNPSDWYIHWKFESINDHSTSNENKLVEPLIEE